MAVIYIKIKIIRALSKLFTIFLIRGICPGPAENTVVPILNGFLLSLILPGILLMDIFKENI